MEKDEVQELLNTTSRIDAENIFSLFNDSPFTISRFVDANGIMFGKDYYDKLMNSHLFRD